MIKLFHTLLGKGKYDDEILAEKSKQAHNIKNEIQKDMNTVILDIHRINKKSSEEINHIAKRLGVATRQLALAMGGGKRGL